MLDALQSRTRQKRLLEVLQSRKLDAAILGLPHHVYYFSAHLPGWQHFPAMVIFADGRSWLTTANEPAKNVAADEVVSYEANLNCTLRQEQPAEVARQVVGLLKARKMKRIGMDASAVTSQLLMTWEGECIPIDPDLWQMRRPKDPDELALIQTATRCTEAMYARAKQIIEPGISELKVYGELHTAAVETAGEPMSAWLGNDYACGSGGGPAGRNIAKDGQIYVLDLGPAFRGYFADNCRSFAVNRKPTDQQLKAARAIEGALAIVEKIARPGARCQSIFTAVDEYLKQTYGRGLSHHLGHGFGLQPHEYPHLNLKWDDTLIEGEVFTAEPGLYGPEINGGIRIENQYVVTKTGVKNLLNFPTDLA